MCGRRKRLLSRIRTELQVSKEKLSKDLYENGMKCPVRQGVLSVDVGGL